MFLSFVISIALLWQKYLKNHLVLLGTGGECKLPQIALLCCCLQGSLPSWNAEMPSLQFLLLDANWNLTGYLPAEWGQNGSMSHLSVLSVHDCNLRGTLPPSWAAQLPNLQVIDLPNNLISGGSQNWPLLRKETWHLSNY